MWFKCALLVCFILSIKVQAQVNDVTEFVNFWNGLGEDVKDDFINATKKLIFETFLSLNFYYEIDCDALNPDNMSVEWEFPDGSGEQPLTNSWLTKLTADQCKESKINPAGNQPNWRGEMRIVNPNTKQAYLKIGASNEKCAKEASNNGGQHPVKTTVYALVGLISVLFLIISVYNK